MPPCLATFKHWITITPPRSLGFEVNVPTFFSSPHPDTKLQHSLCQFFFNHRIKSRKNKPFAIRSWKRESQRNDPQLLTNFEACQFAPRSNPDLAEGFIINPAQQQLVGLPFIKNRHSPSAQAAYHACSGCQFNCRYGLPKAGPFPESLHDRVKRVLKNDTHRYLFGYTSHPNGECIALHAERRLPPR